MSDLNDEFEFKPLTEGLGFHRQVETPQQPVESEKKAKATVPAGKTALPTSSASISEIIAALPSNLDFLTDQVEAPVTKTAKPSVAAAAATPAPTHKRPQIIPPIARQDYMATKASSSAASTNLNMPLAANASPASLTLPTPGTPAKLNNIAVSIKNVIEENLNKTLPTQREATWVESGGHFGSMLLDAMIVTGLSALCLVLVLVITQADLVGLLSNTKTDITTQFHMTILFLCVMQLYLLISRSFAGVTVGEWLFQLRLGTEQQQKTAYYPLLIIWRSLVVTLTGLFPVPILSALIRRDILYFFTGLQLYKRQDS